MPSELKWDEALDRQFEAGIDHGILFVMGTDGTYGEGVAWNGLTSVSESPEGAEPNEIYADNRKYLTLMSAENFKMSLECYTYPDEFNACDGSREPQITSGSTTTGSGVFFTQQKRARFGLAYRTKCGDANGNEWYKLHLVYGCLASPSERAYETINDSPDAMTFSFEISCDPVEITAAEGFAPVAHVEIPEYIGGYATANKNSKYAAVETILKGSSTTASALPDPNDLLSAG